ncbi:SRPBCC family protein [Actinomadura opuntiae]|uniref:SRPBCC family protein n=1 Tax=Actinomadura sp. OS1-43 TaxID=604315 RepID=UPI00255AE8C3|nr:SRPBCC family protein [Actinomadura sp. OS1-43]MDL4814470.1 SRPBCC family protein [Actinomadura sp. OS1-43]
MKRGTKVGPVPIGQIAKRLPVGRKSPSGLGRITQNLPSGIPGGKAIGTTGGVLLGAGAAVAAGRALSRRGGKGDEPEPVQGGSSDEVEAKSGGTSAKGAAGKAVDKAKDTAEKAKDTAGKPAEKAGEKSKGLFGRLKDTVGGILKKGGGKGGGGKKVKVTNIIEHTDIGAPRRLVYDQFTQFQEFPSFMKKVISVDQADEEKLNWQAKIFWSKRTWEATIIEQVPDEHIVWRSKAPKGHVDGTVSFHELAPNLTRVLVVLEYHPQGLFERTGNIWRAQGRRVRLELKHFRRHVMTQSLTHADEIEGWRGEIRDSEVVKTHEDALKEEEAESGNGRKAKSDSSSSDSGSSGSSGSKSTRGGSTKDAKDAKETKDAKDKEYEEASR